jgi:hypothetical protein
MCKEMVARTDRCESCEEGVHGGEAGRRGGGQGEKQLRLCNNLGIWEGKKAGKASEGIAENYE